MKILQKIYYFFRPLLRVRWFVNLILGSNREYVLHAINTYPSVINTGLRHIERVIELAKYFNLDKRNVIVDIGAADGITSIKFSTAFPESKVFAFEPIQDTYNLLSSNVRGYKNINVVNVALGNTDEAKEIHLTKRITSSSLLNINENIENEFFADNLEPKGIEKIFIKRLDHVLDINNEVNIIKIDVQGYELEVLNGAVNTLKKTYLVILEMQNHNLYVNSPLYYDIDRFMRDSGFELYDIIPSIRENQKLYEWDSIYFNKSLVSKK